MEVISSAAAITQLLSQAITVIQKLQEAQAQVDSASERANQQSEQLDDLLDTLQLVQNEKELHTPAVQERVDGILSIVTELENKLQDVVARSSQSKTRQFMHALAKPEKDIKDLNETWTRLDRAKTDLRARILLVHVGISGNIRDGFTAALPIVRRVDRNLQRVLNGRLAVAEQLEKREISQQGGTNVALTEEDMQALGLTTVVDKSEWIGNKVYGESEMYQSDIAALQDSVSSERLYKDNEAHGKSMAFQGRATGDDIVAMIRARRGG